jgi:hypothetical protein
MRQYNIVTERSIIKTNFGDAKNDTNVKNVNVKFNSNVVCYKYYYEPMTIYKNSLYYVNKFLKKIK